MECYTFLRNVTDLLSDGKTPCERRFGQPLKGPTIPFGLLYEYYPISAKDHSRLHQFGQKVLPGFFSRSCIARGRESGKETLWSQTLKNWRRWTHLNSTPEGSIVDAAKKWKFVFPSRRWNSQNLWVRTASENIHFNPRSSGTRRRKENSSRKIRFVTFSNSASRRLNAG